MQRYIVLDLSEFRRPGCDALIAMTAAAGQCEKAAKLVDDSRQFGAVALVDGIVQGMQICLHQPVDAVRPSKTALRVVGARAAGAVRSRHGATSNGDSRA